MSRGTAKSEAARRKRAEGENARRKRARMAIDRVPAAGVARLDYDRRAFAERALLPPGVMLGYRADGSPVGLFAGNGLSIVDGVAL